MTRTKKIYGFRLGQTVPNWKDALGKGGGRIIQLIRLKHFEKFQVQISNGDILTSEFIFQDDFIKKFVNN
jgi:hypothetical protein